VLYRDQSWKWLGQAERWEQLADASSVVKIETAQPSDSAAAA